MKRKELEAMGLEKEQVDQIMTQNGADIEAAKKELQDPGDNTDYGKRGTAGTVEYRK